MSVAETETIPVCNEGRRCPYLGGASPHQILAERDCLRERINRMERAVELAREKIGQLQEEIKNLKDEKGALQEELKQDNQKQFKRNLKKEDDASGKERGAPKGHQGGGRKKPERIDRYVDIRPDKCDRCSCQDIRVYPSFQEHVVQDIEIGVINTSYRFHYGYCPKCKKTIYPKDASAVIPRSRIGPKARAISAISEYLTERQRMSSSMSSGWSLLILLFWTLIPRWQRMENPSTMR